MMVVKKLIAGKFGGLVDKKLSFEKGLNIVHGPNESGKTSWADLFDVLMFGVPRKVAKASNEFDRNVYAKYDMDAGIDIGAIVDIDDNDYTFNKTNAKACEVRDENLNKVPEWSSKNPGSVLFGVNRDTFVQTAFMKQMQPLIEKNAELEMKLSAMAENIGVVNGVAFSDAYKALEEEWRKLTSTTRQNSVLPSLYEQRDNLNKSIEDSKNIFAEIYEIRNDKSELETKLSMAKTSEMAMEVAQAKVLYEEILSLTQQKSDLLIRINELKESLEFDGNIFDESFMDECKNQLDKYRITKKSFEDACQELEILERDLRYYESEKVKYHFFMETDFALKEEHLNTLKTTLDSEGGIQEQRTNLTNEENDVRQQLDKLLIQSQETSFDLEDNDEIKRAEEKNNKYNKTMKTCRWVGSVSLGIAIILLVGIILNSILVVPATIFVVSSIIAFVLGARKYNGETPDEVRTRVENEYNLKEQLRLSEISGEKIYLEKKLEDIRRQLEVLPSVELFDELKIEFKRLLDEAGCINYQGFVQKCHNFREFNTNYLMLSNTMKTKKANVDKQEGCLQVEKTTLENLLEKINIKMENDDVVESKISSLRELRRELVDKTNFYDVCSDKISTRLGDKTLDDIKKMTEISVDDTAAFDNNFSREEIDRMNLQLQECERKIGELQGRLKKSVEMEDLLSELDECENKIKHYSSEKEALDLAKELLKLANDDYEQFFAPKLNEATAEFFKNITGGKYKSVGVDRGFNIKMSSAENLSIFDGNAVSEGTLEQVYFALRLALIDNIYSVRYRPPMFIDDAFVNFDDERFKKSFDVLANLSRKMQIVYFTCKNEVIDYAKDIGANIIEYSDKWAM